MLGVDTALNPFSIRPSYQALLKLPAAERLKRLQDPAVRAQILADEARRPSCSTGCRSSASASPRAGTACSPMGDPPDYEPEAKRQHRRDGRSARTIRRTRSPTTTWPGAADRFLFFPIVGYNEDNHDVIRTMLTDAGDDARAVGWRRALLLDQSTPALPSWMLTHWGRDRKRGPGLPLELIVKRQTSETADFFGFADRGRLAPGLKADVNVIDFERLRLHVPEIRYDLPAGGRRLVQRVDGYSTRSFPACRCSRTANTPARPPGRLVRAAGWSDRGA